MSTSLIQLLYLSVSGLLNLYLKEANENWLQIESVPDLQWKPLRLFNGKLAKVHSSGHLLFIRSKLSFEINLW